MMQFIVGSVAAVGVIAACIGSASAWDELDKIKGTEDEISYAVKDTKGNTVSGTKKAGSAAPIKDGTVDGTKKAGHK